MKTLSKRLKRQQQVSRELKRKVELLEHLVQQQGIMEQNAQKRANLARRELEITQKYMFYLAKIVLEQKEEILIELKDIEDISEKDIDCRVFIGETGKMEKIKLRMK